jgi:hypothetical protein
VGRTFQKPLQVEDDHRGRLQSGIILDVSGVGEAGDFCEVRNRVSIGIDWFDISQSLRITAGPVIGIPIGVERDGTVGRLKAIADMAVVTTAIVLGANLAAGMAERTVIELGSTRKGITLQKPHHVLIILMRTVRPHDRRCQKEQQKTKKACQIGKMPWMTHDLLLLMFLLFSYVMSGIAKGRSPVNLFMPRGQRIGRAGVRRRGAAAAAFDGSSMVPVEPGLLLNPESNARDRKPL